MITNLTETHPQKCPRCHGTGEVFENGVICDCTTGRPLPEKVYPSWSIVKHLAASLILTTGK